MFKLSGFSVNSGKLFYIEEPTNEIRKRMPHVCLAKRNFKFSNLISCVYSTMGSKFKNFFQIIGTSVIGKFECNSVYTLINSFAGR